MRANNFDRFTRGFGGFNRRQILGALAGLLAMSRRNDQNAGAAQLAPSSCGASGAVCTMLSGCCDGLTCVTSAINVNYGVCVPGEGGTVSAGTSLISPFSEDAVEQVSSAAETTETTSTTDPLAEREQRIADRKARRDTHRNKIQSRNTEQKNRREDKKEDKQLRRGPRIGLELFNAGGQSGTETVRVTNKDTLDVVVTRIEPLVTPESGLSLPKPATLDQSDFVQFVSIPETSDPDSIAWFHSAICEDGRTDDGFRVFAAYTTDSINKKFVIMCSELSAGGGQGNGSKRRKNKRRKERERNRRRNDGKHGK